MFSRFTFLVSGLLFASPFADAQSNLVLLVTQPAAYVGAAQVHVTTSAEDISLSGTPSVFTASAFGFTLNFAGPDGAELAVGTYTNAVQARLGGSAAPGINIIADDGLCESECGSFQVLELGTNGSGQVDRLWITFTDLCNCSVPQMTGEVRYSSALAPPAPTPRTIRVPADFATMQAGIDDANLLTVDTVLVSPGSYNESIDFKGKRAVVLSAEGPAVTVISPPPGSSAVTFGSAETSNAVLSGFTITNAPAGLSVFSASPTITSNVIVNCGNGIYLGPAWTQQGASPIICSNAITGCSGAAILQFEVPGSPVLEGNSLEYNGGGMKMLGDGEPTIINNVIRRNHGDGVTSAWGAGVVQNLIVENEGNGVSWSGVAWLVNNTIVGNEGAGISSGSYNAGAQIVNNIVVGNPALFVGGLAPPVIQFNDIYSPSGAAYAGITNLTGIDGNISADPFFACQPGGDFHLLAGSACIDAGTNGAVLLPATDFDGGPRILAGRTGDPAVVDMGAFEFDPSTPPVPCLFLYCPSNMVVVAPAGQESAVVNYPQPFATPGAVVTNWPAAGSVFSAGDDTVSVTAVYGTNVMNCSFTITVLTTDDFGRALGTTNVDWTTSGDASWFVQTAVVHGGLAAAQSGAITNDQASTLQTTLAGPGVLSFWWKVSSETNHDFLYLNVNGSTQAVISGAVDWQPQTIYLGSGPQLVEWTYSKDASGSAGQDAGWLDQVSYTPGAVAPFITAQPASLSVAPGLTAAFSVTVAGTPPLAYQWWFNGQSIAGATTASLAITNVQVSDAGTYSVLVTGQVGPVLSTGAALTLGEVAAWGDNSYGQTNVPLNLTNVMAIAGGWHHSMALKADGTVVAWGDNDKGQTSVPANLSNVVAIASRSGDHSMALRADGTVVVWGDNSYGQTNVPAGLSNVVAIAAGGYQCLVLKADGTALSWGSLDTVPAGLSNAVAIAAGDYANLFVRDDGTVAAVGTAVPAGLSNVIAVAAGGLFNLALQADGAIVAWGADSYGQTSIPAGLTNAVAIGAGDYHSIALGADGAVAVWGKYYNGVSFFPPVVPAGLANPVAIAAGSDHDLALFGSGPPLPELRPRDIGWGGGVFSCSVPTQSGRVYRLEYKNSLADAAWTALPLIAGNGCSQMFSDGTAPGAQRFYRIRRW
jgi:hypothetical protein